MQTLEADYLIVGAGACGIAFADTLLTEAPDATILIVDDRAHPGGHWIDSYDFLSLHQPSAFYGVNSTPLGADTIDAQGHNAGYYRRANVAEVRAYFSDVMQDVLLASGRVRFIPSARYDFEGRTLTAPDETFTVRARRVVDTTYTAGEIPARHTPSYAIAPGVKHAPVNALDKIDPAVKHYVILGAGKTGADAVVHLLDNGVDPAAITWIMPQDVWYYNRALYQPGEEFAEQLFDVTATQMEIAATATTAEECLARLEQSGALMRIDPSVTPGAYRCATMTPSELAQMRRVTNVVRLGRVQSIEADRIVLDHGEIATSPDTLHVDCTAKAVAPKPVRPVFESDRITLQYIRMCQPPFCASFVAFVEAHYSDEARKNTLCTVVPSPERAVDWLSMTLLSTLNAFEWAREPALMNWLASARLNGMRKLLAPTDALTPTQQTARKRLRAATPGAVANLQRLLAY